MAEVVALSTLQEFQLHWPSLPADRTAEATQKLEEASIEVRALYPDIDERLSAGSIQAATVRLVVNRMAKRAMDVPIEDYAGVQSATAQAGPLAQTLTFANPEGNMYMSKNDHRLLRPHRGPAQAWTLMPGGD